MKTTPTRLRRAGAVSAFGALVASSLLLTSPAHAATNVITPNKVDQSDTRATGHNDFTSAGVHVYTDSNGNMGPRTDGVAGTWNTDKAAGYFAVNKSLATAGEPSMTWTAGPTQPAGASLKPGLQLVIDFDNDGSADGILVGEPTYANGANLYGTNWWLSGSGKAFVKAAAPSVNGEFSAPGTSPGPRGGFGSDYNGTLTEWRAAFANAKILKAGWSLGSGVKGDGTISKITVGGDDYTFAANTAPTAGTVNATVGAGGVVSIPLVGADADGDALTYSAASAGSSATVSGSTLTYTADADFVGKTAFTYTVSDGLSTATGRVVVQVAPAKSHAAFVVKGHTKVAVTITSTGNKHGGKAEVYVDGKKRGSAKVHTDGTRTIKLSKRLSNGKHKIRVKYLGTSYTKATSHSATVKVKK